jgi:hypothetical protein
MKIVYYFYERAFIKTLSVFQDYFPDAEFYPNHL